MINEPMIWMNSNRTAMDETVIHVSWIAIAISIRWFSRVRLLATNSHSKTCQLAEKLLIIETCFYLIRIRLTGVDTIGGWLREEVGSFFSFVMAGGERWGSITHYAMLNNGRREQKHPFSITIITVLIFHSDGCVQLF